MTPGARVAAAIEVLDAILAGGAAEKTLVNWARGHRFAGSGDRAAIRDLVFDALRRRRSYAWLGGSESGRGLMIGRIRAGYGEFSDLFSGQGYAPPAVSEKERRAFGDLALAHDDVRLDCPGWLWQQVEHSLGEQAEPVLSTLRDRAPVFLRVNLRKADLETAAANLAEDDIATRPHRLSPTALEVTSNSRRVRHAKAYLEGLVELQDVSSQAVVDALSTHATGNHVLDYCAGGGGKSLAIASAGPSSLTAHDALPERMADLSERSRRAGVSIKIDLSPNGPFGLVLCDVPCSGSGAWRRQPESTWTLTANRLAELNATQDSILDEAAALVDKGGTLAYVTCSILTCENGERVSAFTDRHSDWAVHSTRDISPVEGGDGFHLSLLQRTPRI